MSKKTEILIVEDETPMAMMMVHALTRCNCDVTVANNGQKAMEIATEKRFDLITLDIRLPDASGFSLCSQLKERHISYKTPILFVSASPCQQDIDEARRRGAVDYLPKPFDTTEFVHKVIYYARAKQLLNDERESMAA